MRLSGTASGAQKALSKLLRGPIGRMTYIFRLTQVAAIVVAAALLALILRVCSPYLYATAPKELVFGIVILGWAGILLLIVGAVALLIGTIALRLRDAGLNPMWVVPLLMLGVFAYFLRGSTFDIVFGNLVLIILLALSLIKSKTTD
jgi:hypothetical protein